MAKPTDTVPPWATAGVYPPSVYGALVPEMIPNPLAGLPTPWSGLPRTEAGTLAAFAAQGLSPQIPTAAQEYNEWLQRVGEWANWVEAGSSADDADAHIVETNGAGLMAVLAGEFTLGAFGAGSTQLPLPHGAVIPDTKTLTMEDGSDIALQGDASISGPTTTSVTTGVVQVTELEILPAPPAPTARQLTAGTDDALVWNDGALQLVHYSVNGWVYATGDQEAATGLLVTQTVATTTVAVEGRGLGNVRVIVVGQAQVSSLGSTIDVNVQEDQTANPAFTQIGGAQVLTTTHTQADANAWQDFRHERIFAAGAVTATLYRATVTANGGRTVSVKEVRLRVVGERA